MEGKCYDVKVGTLGYVDGGKEQMLFPTEDEYFEYKEDNDDNRGVSSDAD